MSVNYFDFEYLQITGTNLPWAVFPFDFSQSSTLTEYISPLWSSIVSHTSYWSVLRLNLNDPIVEWINWTVTAIFFCDAFNWTLISYTWGSTSDWIYFNDSVGQRDYITWTNAIDSITCDIPFDLAEFDSQQLYDIKTTLFFTFIIVLLFFIIWMLKPLFFWTKKSL